jgi:hypothetical protein
MRDDKHESLLVSDQGKRGEASGAVSGAVVMAYAIRHSKVDLESSWERGARAGFQGSLQVGLSRGEGY